VFTNVSGSVVTTSATVHVSTVLTITTNPASQTVTAGQSVTFTAAATASPAATVQWEFKNPLSKNYSAIAGATNVTNVNGTATSTYSFIPTAAQGGNVFVAVFSNGLISANTSPATLTVLAPPTVITNPSDQVLDAGQSVTFTASAAPVSATVQWQTLTPGGQWTTVAGATSTSLTISNTKTKSGTQYKAVFTDTAGSTASAPATLIVDQVVTQPKNTSISVGANATFTVTSVNQADAVQWYIRNSSNPTWQPISDGPVTGSKSAAYQGTKTTSLEINAADATMSGDEFMAVFTNADGTVPSGIALLTVR
jgi:hypothetical protein